MDFLSNFHFIRPLALLLIPIAIGLWWRWQRTSEPLRGWRSQIAPPLLQALTVGQHGGHQAFARWLLAGWLLTITAIAGPTWQREPSPFAEDSPPLMILLKADQSMEPNDQQLTSLERAKLKIADLAKARQGEPLGLIVYAGSAHLVLPPTKDTSVIAQMASEVSSNIMPAMGDRLDLAVKEAQRIRASEPSACSLLVIADSVETEATKLHNAVENISEISAQFLAINDSDPSKQQSIQNAARILNASITELAVDDTDIDTIVGKAERISNVSIAGEETHWQEAGYWFVPIIALLAALSFRRETVQVSREVQ